MNSNDNLIIYTKGLLFNIVLVFYHIWSKVLPILWIIPYNGHPIYKGPMNKNFVQLI